MKRLLVLCLCGILVGGTIGCGKIKGEELPSINNKTQNVADAEKEETGDTFNAGVYTTSDYKLEIGDAGLAEEERFVINYTLTNTSESSIKPSEVWGYTVKVQQLDEPLMLASLSSTYADSYKELTDVLEESVKPGEVVEGMVVFEVPYGKEVVDITIKALDTETNKSLGELTLGVTELKLEVKEETSKTEEPKVEAEELPDEERTGADDALAKTQREIQNEVADAKENANESTDIKEENKESEVQKTDAQ